jgi:hypothetical protein
MRDLASRAPVGQHAVMAKWSLFLPALLATGCGQQPNRPEIGMAVEDLWRNFDADEAAAERRFANVTILVDGRVEAIGSPGSARPVAWLQLPQGSAPAFLNAGPASQSLRASIGQRRRFRCESVDHLGATPYLHGCVVIGG